MTEREIDAKVDARAVAELGKIDAEEQCRDMLDEIYSFKSVGGIFAGMSPARVLEEVDPTAYRCGFNDWADSERDRLTEIDGDHYDADEVQAIRNEVEAESEEPETVAP
jgi:hypothetical protein